MDATQKTCSTCGETKPAGDFHKSAQSSDGLRNQCKACRAVESRSYYEANRDRVRSAVASYRLENRESIAEYKREWTDRNKESVAARRRDYRKRNRPVLTDRDRVFLYIRRASAAGFDPVFERFTAQDVIDAYGDKCAYCSSGPFEHLDHFVPVSKGGPHTLENVRPSCAACNMSKGSADPRVASDG